MDTYERCSKTCADARLEALRALKLCLNKGGRFADSRVILKLSETMRLCQLASDFCASFVEESVAPCVACADECAAAAALLDTLQEPVLAGCADGLRLCAEACLQAVSETVKPVKTPSKGSDLAAIEAPRSFE